jgi:hypothetical protein
MRDDVLTNTLMLLETSQSARERVSRWVREATEEKRRLGAECSRLERVIRDMDKAHVAKVRSLEAQIAALRSAPSEAA